MIMASGNGSGLAEYGKCYPTFTEDARCDIILGIKRVVGVISMCCCIFIVFLIILFKKYKFLSQRLILYLSIASFFQAIGYIVGDYRIAYYAINNYRAYHGWCVFQGYWVLFFDWLSFLWVLCITFNIIVNAVFLKRTDKFEKFYAIAALIVPVILCCFPFIGHSYGPAGLWCWISSVRDGDIYKTGVAIQLAVFYVPLWLLCIVQVVTLLIAFCIVRRRVKKFRGKYDPLVDTYQKLWEEEIRPVMLFPWIYILILVFPLINRVRQAAGFHEPESGANFFLWFMHSVTLTLHGTVYALVFACDKQTLTRIRWKHFKAAFISWCGKKPVQEYDFEVSNRRETIIGKKYDVVSPINTRESESMDMTVSNGTSYSLYKE